MKSTVYNLVPLMPYRGPARSLRSTLAILFFLSADLLAGRSTHASDDAQVEAAPTDTVVPGQGTPPAEPSPGRTATADGWTLPGHRISISSKGWTATWYGFVELDAMRDSTQSFADATTNGSVVPPNSVVGDNPRMQLSVKNSRFGLEVAAPDYGGAHVLGLMEIDAFGNQGQGTTQNDLYSAPVLRLRHFYLKVTTRSLSLLAGQYHDLFAWGGAGFYPNTLAFLPITGEIYHRDPQVRLSKLWAGEAATFEIELAAVRPGQVDGGLPDGQVGARLALNRWTGASAPGASQPVAAPMAIGVSAVGRHLSVNDFSQKPGNPRKLNGGGIALNVFLPIIPASGDDLRNALSVSGEVTSGTGISDLYANLTGGMTFPSLPNPNNLLAVPTYAPNVDPGVVGFDADFNPHTVNWTAFWVNAHYHLPFGYGRSVWLSASLARLKSTNALDLTPPQGQSSVWNQARYYDGTLWWAITPTTQLAAAAQLIQQYYGEGPRAENLRGEGSFFFFF
ncbi:MAG TPA: hypothetical protein VG319_10735 [Polyangia bacterium]|nr:hypothetical protein [Polyangia bacterium]